MLSRLENTYRVIIGLTSLLTSNIDMDTDSLRACLWHAKQGWKTRPWIWEGGLSDQAVFRSYHSYPIRSLLLIAMSLQPNSNGLHTNSGLSEAKTSPFSHKFFRSFLITKAISSTSWEHHRETIASIWQDCTL